MACAAAARVPGGARQMLPSALRLHPRVSMAAAPAMVGLAIRRRRVMAPIVRAGVAASLSLDGTTDAGVLASPLSLDVGAVAVVIAPPFLNGAADPSDAGVLVAVPVRGSVPGAAAELLFRHGDGATHAGVLVAVPARGSVRGAGKLLFLRGDAAASLGVSCAALASTSTAGGRASRGGAVVVAARATAGSEAEGRDDNGSDSAKLGAFVMHDMLAILAHDGLLVLDEIVPASAMQQFAAKHAQVKTGLKKALMLAHECSTQIDAALEIRRGWYGIVELAHALYPNAGVPLLLGKQDFLSKCGNEPVILGQTIADLEERGMPDSDVGLIQSIFTDVVICQTAVKTARARANYVACE